MGFQKYVPHTFVYEYDFARSGGAQGNINLTCLGNNALAADMIIKDWTINIETAIAGVGATITMGNSLDRDGYAVDFAAAATDGATINQGDRAGALVWDDTNDHPISYKLPTSAASVPSVTIGTADLTAGKFKVIFTAIRM